MRNVTPYSFILDITTPISSLNVRIQGKSFLSLRNLYLSGSDPAMFTGVTYFHPFSSNTRMSIMYPAFSAIQIPEFTVESEKIVYFNLTQMPQTTGYIDIILENEAGYGKLTIDSRMPFISSYVGAIDIQNPWVNGILIISSPDYALMTVEGYQVNTESGNIVDVEH